MDDFKQIQGDTLSGHATDVLPFLDGITISDDPLAKTALDELRKWDRRSNKDSTGALIYEAFWRQLGQNIFKDELGDELSADALDRGTAERTAVTNALKDPSAHWWDDVSTASVKETREQIIVKSLKDTAAFLKSKFGDDASKWKWANAHTVTFRNSTLGNSGISLIDSIFNRGPFAANGASAAVNNVGSNADFSSTSGPSLRMIVDMSNLNNSVIIHTTGQSGHTYHPHYDDMIQKWLDIQYNPFYFARADVERNSEGTLVLNP
jgi:penicillin amidase